MLTPGVPPEESGLYIVGLPSNCLRAQPCLKVCSHLCVLLSHRPSSPAFTLRFTLQVLLHSWAGCRELRSTHRVDFLQAVFICHNAECLLSVRLCVHLSAGSRPRYVGTGGHDPPTLTAHGTDVIVRMKMWILRCYHIVFHLADVCRLSALYLPLPESLPS